MKNKYEVYFICFEKKLCDNLLCNTLSLLQSGNCVKRGENRIAVAQLLSRRSQLKDAHDIVLTLNEKIN